jgi:O-antigen/teichoic acid export membrane protein
MIKNKINLIFKNQFVKDVSIASSGTIVSQIIVLMVYPFVTRYFSAESFGTLAIFTSLSSFLIIFSTGRYDHAMVLIQDDQKAMDLLRLIGLVGIFSSVVYFVVYFFIREIISLEKYNIVFYLVPVYTFVIVIYTGLGVWHERSLNYKVIAKALILHSLTTALGNLFFGKVLHFQSGLIISLIIGPVVGVIYLVLNIKHSIFADLFTRTFALAKEFIDFPKYLILSELALAISLNFIPIVFGFLFDLKIVGYYSLASRILRMPNLLVANSIGSVFKNEAAKSIKESGNCERLFIQTLKRLMYFSLPIYLFLALFSPKIFVLVFGESWLFAGRLAQILSALMLIEFMVVPLKNVFYLTKNNNSYLIIQLVGTITGIGAIFIGHFFFKDVIIALSLYCLVAVLFNLTLLYFSYKYSSNP